MDKKKTLRILVPLLMILVIAGVWIFKNNDKSVNPPSVPSPAAEDDFALNADSIDIEELTSYGLPIIIDFGADYCGPCREFSPILEEVYAETQGKAIIKYVDTALYGDIARNFPVTVIPTQVFINPDGTAYKPSDGIDVDFKMYGDSSTGEVFFTVHEGGLTKEQMLAILADMGVSE